VGSKNDVGGIVVAFAGGCGNLLSEKVLRVLLRIAKSGIDGLVPLVAAVICSGDTIVTGWLVMRAGGSIVLSSDMAPSSVLAMLRRGSGLGAYA